MAKTAQQRLEELKQAELQKWATPTQAPAATAAPAAPKAAQGNTKYGTFTDPVRQAIDKFVETGYVPGQSVTDAYQAYQQQLNTKPGEYQSQYDAAIADAFGNIMNRGKFQYDMNADTLYQQMKDRYLQQGDMAMQDTMGQAAAMTGGYGNSYAQSVGQQVYNQHLTALNDNVPALRDRAYQEWSDEGSELYRQLGLMQGLDDRDYGRHRDTVADWQTMLGLAQNRYQDERGFDYGKYADQRAFDYGKYRDEVNLAESQFQSDRGYGYGKFADQRAFDYNQDMADRDWAFQQEQWQYKVQQDAEAKALAAQAAAAQAAAAQAAAASSSRRSSGPRLSDKEKLFMEWYEEEKKREEEERKKNLPLTPYTINFGSMNG